MDIEPLVQIGLTQGESKVYMALLTLGTSSVGAIITEAEISRSKVYEILERLRKKGFASVSVENGVKQFTAVDPRVIPDHLEERKRDVEKQILGFKEAIPALLAQAKDQSAEVEVFTGWRGVQNVFNSLIKDAQRGDTWYAFGVSGLHKKRIRFFQKWRKATDAIGIQQKLIVNEALRKSSEIAPRSKFTNARFTSQETPTSVDIFKEHVVLGIWVETPILVKLKGTLVSDSFKVYFDSLWKTAKK